MSNNFVQQGDFLTLTAPYTLTSGQGVKVGAAIFGVATGGAAMGASVDIATAGVFQLTKTSEQAWTIGQPIYWDNDQRECTNDPQTADLPIGVAVAGATNPSSTGRVRLHGALGL